MLHRDLCNNADLINNYTINRLYNDYGEIIQEDHSSGINYKWEYDNNGRCLSFYLHDSSSIEYKYVGKHLVEVKRYRENKEDYCHKYTKFDENGHVQEEEMIANLEQVKTEHDRLERPILTQSKYWEYRAEYNEQGLITESKNTLLGDKSYSYDNLNQLKSENTSTYCFDSLGNPVNCIVNDNCQIIYDIYGEYFHDINGNLVKQNRKNEEIEYQYDVLGRLISIIYPNKKKLLYVYDGFSRLLTKTCYNYTFGKWNKSSSFYYLHDKDYEIGLCNQNKEILELKVLGLGINGDIGAAVAIEIKENVYVPFHDFNGNILAILSTDGNIVETYHYNAFGNDSSNNTYINPWRFCSKRHEECLIYFKERFYNPSMQRWISPDPAGFIESTNLYVYVLNNPVNRLDLFGLFSNQFMNDDMTIRIPTQLMDISHTNFFLNDVFHCKGYLGRIGVDFVVNGSFIHQLQFTAEEMKSGKIKLNEHFHDFISKDGSCINICSGQNGVLNSINEFKEMSQSIVDKLPNETPYIGLYNPSDTTESIGHATAEVFNYRETKKVKITRQFISCMVENIHKINPSALWFNTSHSESGAIFVRAIEGLEPDKKDLVKHHLLYYGIGPALPMPQDYVYRVWDVYSNKDYITGRFGKKQINDVNYNIKILPCISKPDEMIFKRIDHYFMGTTYQEELKNQINYLQRTYRFKNENNR